MLSSVAFSLVLITSGTVEYAAEFRNLAACEAEVKRLRPQLKDSGIAVACMPVNSVTHQDIDQRMSEMMAMMRRMREKMDKDWPGQDK